MTISPATTQQPRPGTSAMVLMALPLASGVLAAVIILVAAPNLELRAWTKLWAAPLGAGLLLSAIVSVPVLARWRAARARADGAAAAAQAALQAHHQFMLRLDHELKNPVTAMQAGMANLAGLLDGGTHPEAAGALDSVTIQTRRVADLVADLRKLAELETRPIDEDTVDLEGLLKEVGQAAEELTDDDGRTLTLILPQAPWPLSSVTGDRDLLFLAFYNLLANAAKFTQDGDTIEMRAHEDGTRVVVEVADTGIGIPPDEVDQVWDELSRGRAARGTPGMGLGLAMVRAVISRHGGTVSMHSRDGHGTLVSVRLPVAGPGAA